MISHNVRATKYPAIVTAKYPFCISIPLSQSTRQAKHRSKPGSTISPRPMRVNSNCDLVSSGKTSGILCKNTCVSPEIHMPDSFTYQNLDWNIQISSHSDHDVLAKD